MATWQIILIPAGLIALGLIRQLLILRKKVVRHDLATEFLDKFLEWCEGNARDHSLYNWMIHHSDTVQAMLARSGLVCLRRPFENGYHTDYPVILNAIPEIHRMYGNNLLRLDDNCRTMIQLVADCLRRFIGRTEEQYRRERMRLFNPLVLFCGGVAWLMELPLFILSETKIITTSRRAIIVNGRAFSLLSGVVALATLVATVMNIVMGWDKFVAVVTGWMQ
ncbi:MAG: hypothetical protein Kow00105_15870 [Phycisphaeraceae bacterium]